MLTSLSSKNLRSVFQPQNDGVSDLHPASVAKQQISLTQGVGVMTACTNISLRGKRSSPSIPSSACCKHGGFRVVDSFK